MECQDAKGRASHVEAAAASDQHEKDVEVNLMEDANLVYEVEDTEPEIHIRTWIAVAAMLFLNFVQVIALQGPPVVVSQPQLTEPLDGC